MIPAQPPHGRKLGILGTSLTKARLDKLSGKALDFVRDGLEQLIAQSNYLEGAPFSWVTISIRYGLKNEDTPHYEKINRRYGDLPLSIEVDTHELIGATLAELTKKFKVSTLKALIHAGKKYERPTEQLEAELSKLETST